MKIIQIEELIFELTESPSDKGIISAGNFYVQGHGRDRKNMSEEQSKTGHMLLQEIFNGVWNWLIEKPDFIRILGGKINVFLGHPIYSHGVVTYGSSRIESSLKEICPHCNGRDCEFDCVDALEWASDRDPEMCRIRSEELEELRDTNRGFDIIESMIIAHAQNGLFVDSEAYEGGVQAAIDAFANNSRT